MVIKLNIYNVTVWKYKTYTAIAPWYAKMSLTKLLMLNISFSLLNDLLLSKKLWHINLFSLLAVKNVYNINDTDSSQ